ncbi:hypothetical protein G6F50_017164 [Rhizopus delemar]|uniref:Uncharacterized protein n=1 Tax=Rhizopus delemar TaxID=936053 RepID=A0A9P7C050_9FUNG|nr:hypothetical protein G6F50_017164 [Rhizopus delemar]
MDDGQLAQRLGGGGQRRDQVAVELDHRQLRMHAQQRQRDRALARTDFDQAVAVFRIDRHHDLVDVVAIGQEMLAKLLLGRGGEHRAGGGMRGIHALSVRCRASCAHSVVAACRLEGSAMPRPARSSAVPWSTATRG